MSLWTCFTDGGCQGNPGPCAWGAVVIPPDGGARIEGSGFLGHGTNQIAELRAHGRGRRHGLARRHPQGLFNNAQTLPTHDRRLA